MPESNIDEIYFQTTNIYSEVQQYQINHQAVNNVSL